MKINRFLQTVTSHIYSKEAKEYVKIELNHHLQMSKQSWVKRGYSDVEAEEKAVQEMGSPISLGKSLNKLHKPRVDWLLISLFSLLLLLSFLPIFALNHKQFLDSINFSLSTMIINKVIFIIIGALIAIGMMFVDYRKLKRWGYLFYSAGVGLIMILQYFPNQIQNGEPMIAIGGFEIQIWMAIPFLLIAWASLFSNLSFKLWQGIILFVLSIYLFLHFPNLPILFTYIVLVGILFLQSKFTRKEKLIIVGTSIMLVVGVIGYTVFAYSKGLIAQYQLIRILAFISPEEYSDSSGYLYLTLETVLNNAGMFGTKNFSFIEEAHTNLVLSNLIQNYGFVMGIAIVVILVTFLARIWVIARAIKDPFGKLLIIGGITVFATQFLYSVGMTFRLLPLTSMPLPFMSYGLMPTVLSAFIVGIALSVYRRKHFIQFEKDKKTRII
ncbi:MAG TPA: FtsW/RodA/SpoVE family cell cycle protein [Ureibacillus sp.]|nr:FtsW/RodA/SpoVE family cell cycle protein [Ureibacillus sp.]